MTSHEDLSLAVACARALVERNAAMLQGHGTCHDGYLFAVADSAFAFVRNSIANKQEQLIALFHGKSYKVRGTVPAQETPE